MDTRRAIIRDSLGVATATGAYGVGFGAVSVASGLSVLQTCALSLLAFTGASQFALVGVVGAGGAPLVAMVSGLLLGTRNTLYGIRMAPLLGYCGWRRAAAAHVLIDESTAMGVGRATRAGARTGFWWTGVGVFVGWNLATLAGALAGNAIGDPRRYGLDAAVAAAFLALLWPQLSTLTTRLVGVGAAALALAVVPMTVAGVPVLIAGLMAVLGGVLSREATESDPANPFRDEGS